ncbi:hypothetical protein [Microtetraspora glauca]|uniref:Uncharacterized protein n=1 Tax=Microtetraspora glauca TaxID=1996 RepID=A0ABV3GCB9_MICGL
MGVSGHRLRVLLPFVGVGDGGRSPIEPSAAFLLAHGTAVIAAPSFACRIKG